MPMRIDKPALIVVDMQEQFRGVAECIVPRINATIALARAHNLPVVYTMHGHADPEKDQEWNVLVIATASNSGSETASVVVAAYLGKHHVIKKHSHAYQLMPEVDIDPAVDIKIEKDVYDAFQGSPNLEEVLKDKRVNGLLITGINTNLCDETTARNFGIVFVHDCCNTFTTDMHESTLVNMRYGFGEVITHNEVKRRIETKGLQEAFAIGVQ